MEWMLMPYRRLYALIAGRASRQEFWMFVLLNVIVAAVFIALLLVIIGASASVGNINDVGAAMAGAGFITLMLLIVPLYVWALVTAVASFGVTIRRFHDLNLSGWVYLPFLILGLVPLLNVIVWIAFIVVMCLKGTTGENKYGNDPTDTSNTAVFA